MGPPSSTTTPKPWNMLWPLVCLTILFLLMVAAFIYLFIQWYRIIRIENALHRAWYNMEVCDVEDCEIRASNDLWGLQTPTSSTKGEFDAKTARTLIEFIGRLNVLSKPDDVPTSPDGYTLLQTFRPSSKDANKGDDGPPFVGIWQCVSGTIIAFRATTTNEEIRQDLMFEQVVWEDGMNVHSGFVQVYEAYQPHIDKVLVEKHEAGKPIYVTGHSLGGSVATMMALHYGKTRAIIGYVYGCPRIGGQECDTLLRERVPNFWRVSNRSDLITTMPPVVTPSISSNSKIYFYYPAGKEHSFDVNWKSLRTNHFLPVYSDYLDEYIQQANGASI